MSNVTKTVPAPAARRSGLRRPLLIAAAVVALLMLVYAGYTIWRMSYVPAGLEFNTTQLSQNGLYRATIVPDQEPIIINQLHSWVLHVETSDGQPLSDATISVDGDMPQHGHGMPTQPQVTQNLGSGDYLVEGMRFQMGGWWVVDFVIESGGQQDNVSFNLMLEG